MKTCKGCGAFYYDVCPYCGYREEEKPKERHPHVLIGDEIIGVSGPKGHQGEDPNQKFVTLDLMGDRNTIIVKHGECNREKVEIMGDRQNQTIIAEYINIDIMGDRNTVKVDSKVKYFTDIMGNRNIIQISRNIK